MECKSCGSDKVTKNGKDSKWKQRYKCKSCGIRFRDGDERLKHGLSKRIKVIKMYLGGVGIRSIERLEDVSGALIVYWMRHFSRLIRKEMSRKSLPDKVEDIAILEVDELFTYYKKRPSEPMYGLLLTETEIRLLISK